VEALVDGLRRGVGHAAGVDGVAVARLAAAHDIGVGHEVADRAAARVDGDVARGQLPVDRRAVGDERCTADHGDRAHAVQAGHRSGVDEGGLPLRVCRGSDDLAVSPHDRECHRAAGQRLATGVA